MNKNLYILISFLFCFLFELHPQHQSGSTIPVTGRVIADDTGSPLENATLSISNTNVATVTNQEGYFSFRLPNSARNYNIKVEYMGYENVSIPVITLIDRDDNVIRMKQQAIELEEIEVVSGDGTQLMKEALSLITKNYETEPNMMVAFYREGIKKGSNHISLVETVLDVYKESYRSFKEDQARIYIGRKATDISPRDTVFMKFQGGISGALLLDIAKHSDIVFGESVNDYSYHIDGIVNIDNRPHYIIDFQPLPNIKEILFRGRVYLDVESLAFKRMEFNMNVENRKEATSIFIKKKPSTMRVSAENAKYIVDFVEKNGKWYFNYSSTEVQFKVRWKRRFFGLFASTYTISSEMAITDRYENDVQRFPRKERIRSTDVIAEKVEYFQDPDFWGDYTVIEPDKEISSAIKRLSGKLKRRD